MDKRYIIVFAVAVAAAVGFFVYKDKKMENELEAHNQQQYERIIEVANSSSVAGLGQMGLALNKYKKEKGNYPDTLSALYPDYIPVKAFIDDIKWYYEPDEDDFILSKTIRTKDDGIVTAAIDSDLMPIETTTVASASTDEIQKPPEEVVVKTTTQEPEELEELEEPEVRITLASLSKPKPITEEVSPQISTINWRKPKAEFRNLPKPLESPRSAFSGLEQISTKKLNQQEQYVQRVQGNLLVWKNDDGSVGFGNVQYPSSEEMTIYDNEGWVQVRQRIIDSQREAEPLKPQKKRRIHGNFLVWKNDDGSLGYGNVQYPTTEKMTIYDNEEWVQIHQRIPEAQIQPAVWEPPKEKSNYLDRLVATRSDNFLVWKDSRGVVSFGNVQYPINKRVQIHVDGRWQPVNN